MEYFNSLFRGNKCSGGKLKETGFTHWNSPNTGATNESGFTAIGAGFIQESITSLDINNKMLMWTSAESSSTQAIYWYLEYNIDYLGRYGFLKSNGYSVRLIKD